MPTDALSSVTSSMAKMGEGEAMAIQVIISPAESEWSKAGAAFLSKTKKDEANPEKAKFKMSPEDMAAIDAKIGKPGFLSSVRLVSVAPTDGQAKGNLSNLKSAFSQFNSDKNGFSGKN